MAGQVWEIRNGELTQHFAPPIEVMDLRRQRPSWHRSRPVLRERGAILALGLTSSGSRRHTSGLCLGPVRLRYSPPPT